jgi:hypothetical protein
MHQRVSFDHRHQQLYICFRFNVVHDQINAPIATVIYNPQHSPYIFEDFPPSYDSVGEIKKDFRPLTTADNVDGQVELRTLTNLNDETSTTMIHPSATISTLNPPPYVDSEESNK